MVPNGGNETAFQPLLYDAQGALQALRLPFPGHLQLLTFLHGCGKLGRRVGAGP
jgi:hypothetical protein